MRVPNQMTARGAGVLVALPCAVVLRRFQLVAGGARPGASELSGSVYEIALVILSAYMAYLVAEARAARASRRALQRSQQGLRLGD
jgi:hypothetical protein